MGLSIAIRFGFAENQAIVLNDVQINPENIKIKQNENKEKNIQGCNKGQKTSIG